MTTRSRTPGADPLEGGGKDSPRPRFSSGEAARVGPAGQGPATLAGRWARAALERLVSSAGEAPSVLLAGEPGTGKRLLARAFHERRHPEGRAPLEIVRPAAGAGDDEVYAAVFGREGRRPGVRGGLYWPGAIERARGGSVILDGLERFPGRLIEAVAEYLADGVLRPLGGDTRRAVPCALVATAASLKVSPKMSPAHDLARRFDTVIHVPPLRERTGDIEDLFRYFAKRTGFGGFPARAAGHFAALPWPGNVPELRDKVEAEAAHWLDSCALPGRSRAEVEREVRESWAPRTVPAGPVGPKGAPKKAPAPAARGTKKAIILSLAEEISKGTLAPEDAARRARTSVSYTRQVLRKAGVGLPAGRK